MCLVLHFKKYYENLAHVEAEVITNKEVNINKCVKLNVSVQIKDCTPSQKGIFYTCEFSWVKILSTSVMWLILILRYTSHIKWTLFMKMIRGRRRIKTLRITKINKNCFSNEYWRTSCILICVYSVNVILCQETSIVSVIKDMHILTTNK